MNSMERFRNVLAGKAVDRRPFSLILSLYGARFANCPIEQYYGDPLAFARGQAAIREIFKPDFLYAPFFFAAIGAAFGGKLRYLDHGVPTVTSFALNSAQELDNLRIPDPDQEPHLLFVREALRRMVADHRGEVPIAIGSLAPFDIPSMIMGPDTWMETVLFDRPAAERVMRRVIPFFVELANRYFEDGAAFLVSPCVMLATKVVTRDIVVEFSRPALVEALSQLRGPMILHHLDYAFIPHLDLLTDLPPAASALILGPNDDLNRARELVGPGPVLMNGPDVQALLTWTPEAVEAFCRTKLEDRRGDARFVLANSGGDLTLETPPENLYAMRRAVESFGKDRP